MFNALFYSRPKLNDFDWLKNIKWYWTANQNASISSLHKQGLKFSFKYWAQQYLDPVWIQFAKLPAINILTLFLKCSFQIFVDIKWTYLYQINSWHSSMVNRYATKLLSFIRPSPGSTPGNEKDYSVKKQCFAWLWTTLQQHQTQAFTLTGKKERPLYQLLVQCTARVNGALGVCFLLSKQSQIYSRSF